MQVKQFVVSVLIGVRSNGSSFSVEQRLQFRSWGNGTSLPLIRFEKTALTGSWDIRALGLAWELEQVEHSQHKQEAVQTPPHQQREPWNISDT